jgi:H+-transporting ATPase
MQKPRVQADARLLDGDPVEVDQSALTGESLPVDRKSGDTLYCGSILKKGEMDALVSAMGRAAFFGKTAQLVESAHTVSHFQKAVLKIGDTRRVKTREPRLPPPEKWVSA